MSKCSHDFTFGIASYNYSAITTGSFQNPDCGLRTEIYNFELDSWSDGPDWIWPRDRPNSRSISHYGVASTSTAAYFIGGWDGSSPLEMIMEFKNNTWKWHGDLLQSRAYHQTLTYNDEIVIFGGRSIDGS